MVAIIPARSGSKSIIDKNIIDLGGVPIIAHTILCALECKLIEQTYVSTDSKKYADISRDFGALTPFLRPDTLAQDDSSDYDFVLHFLTWFFEDHGYYPKYLIHLRPTTPLRDSKVVDQAISDFLHCTPGFTSLRSAHESAESAYKQFEIDSENCFVSAFSRVRELDTYNNARQSFPATYKPNGYVDILDVDFILREKKLHGDKVRPFITGYTHELDCPEDIEILRVQFGQRKGSFDV